MIYLQRVLMGDDLRLRWWPRDFPHVRRRPPTCPVRLLFELHCAFCDAHETTMNERAMGAASTDFYAQLGAAGARTVTCAN